ncbi:MAG: insulinase family protein, partial [Alphaproteobacteria bacterium]|nr:insulinase family protein [Alphaproteobacteria bacterium]
GVAHYLEHLMFKGPEGSLSKDITRIIERVGGQYNATTGPDYTNYYEVVSSDKIEDMMKAEAERMKSLVIQEEEARTELDVIQEERKMRLDANPLGLFIEALHAVWFWNHPYGRSGIGYESEIKALTPQKARDFYAQWYAPNNAVLIYAGDVNFEDIKQKVITHFGSIKKRQLPQRLRAQEPPHNGVRQKLVMHSHNIVQPYFIRINPLPNFARQKKDSYATEVLSYLLTMGPTSYLSQQLVEKNRIATFIKFDTPFLYALDPSFGALIAQPANGISIEKLETLLDAALVSKKTKGFSGQEVEKAKRRLLASLVYLRDNTLGGAQEFGSALMVGLSLEEIESWPDHIKAVTTEDVNRVFKDIFFSAEHLTGYLLPENQKTPRASKPHVQ